MTVTEEEAKTKLCQETYGGGPGSIVRQEGITRVPSHCIASACMAWRWQDSLSLEHQRGDGGYCGKAGAP